jgi:putative endonuclease
MVPDTPTGWFVYVVRCADDSLYTGITTDVTRRVEEHNGEARGGRGARYTRARRPVELVRAWSFGSRSEAASAEYAFKKLSRQTKLARLKSEEWGG